MLVYDRGGNDYPTSSSLSYSDTPAYSIDRNRVSMRNTDYYEPEIYNNQYSSYSTPFNYQENNQFNQLKKYQSYHQRYLKQHDYSYSSLILI